ncbi:MAG: hypothetical protein AABW79_03925 [Nanoarchaeota archaeon]
METIYVQRIGEIKKQKDELEKKLKVSLEIKGKQVTINGPSLEEYEATVILEAISFGFSIQAALILKEEDAIFRKINIKHVTRRKNLAIVKARLIGTEGKTKRTLENLADCKILIKDNEIGIIGPADEIEEATTGIEILIRGSKQSNVYNYLEKMNKKRKDKVKIA